MRTAKSCSRATTPDLRLHEPGIRSAAERVHSARQGALMRAQSEASLCQEGSCGVVLGAWGWCRDATGQLGVACCWVRE
jgi:hypothetical protein